MLRSYSVHENEEMVLKMGPIMEAVTRWCGENASERKEFLVGSFEEVW